MKYSPTKEPVGHTISPASKIARTSQMKKSNKPSKTSERMTLTQEATSMGNSWQLMTRLNMCSSFLMLSPTERLIFLHWVAQQSRALTSQQVATLIPLLKEWEISARKTESMVGATKTPVQPNGNS